MHTLTIQTKFTFGDRVRFYSRAQQGLSGRGTVFAITIDNERQIDYIISIGEGLDHYLQPGILEHELELEDQP